MRALDLLILQLSLLVCTAHTFRWPSTAPRQAAWQRQCTAQDVHAPPPTEQLVDTLESLARASPACPWAALPRPQRDSLQRDLALLLPALSAQQAVQAVWSLGKLRLSAQHLPPGSASQLYSLLACASFERRAVAKLVFGLAAMRVGWADLPAATRGNILAHVESSCAAMNEMEVVNTVYSFGKMALRWDGLDVSLQRALAAACTRVAPHMQQVGASNLFWGLGKIEAAWEELPGRTRGALATRLSQLTPLGPQCYSNIVGGLANMNASFRGLSPELRRLIITGLAAALHAPSAPAPAPAHASAAASKPSRQSLPSEQTVATAVWALGCLGVDYRSDLNSTAQDALTRALTLTCPLFTSQGLSNTIYG